MDSLIINNLGHLSYEPEEALNRLRVNLGFCGKKYKKIIVTSSTPNEGKSFISANLWRLLAEAGHRVLLIDADMRKSILCKTLQISSPNKDIPLKKHAGIVKFLTKQAALDDVVYSTNIEHAFILPVFKTIPNPSLLLQNDRFSEMLKLLEQHFDYILVDTPPLGNVSDADLIASKCDGALLVVRSGVTPRRMISSSIQQLEHAGCPLIGSILNGVEMRATPYNYRYNRYGSHYYYYTSEYYNHSSDKRGHE